MQSPFQWLGDNSWDEKDSGKFKELRQIAEEVASRQEKMLVFSQFREVTEILSGFLARIFGRQGLLLHGNAPIFLRP